VFFYDCVNDVLIGQIFDWSHISLIFLWATLNYRIFPPKLSTRGLESKFSYQKTATSGAGFLSLSEQEFFFGENIHSHPFHQILPPTKL